MRKLFLLTLLICFLCCGTMIYVRGQDARVQAREAEWQSYSLPKSNFIRQSGAEKEFLFRVPAGWKQDGGNLVFIGPHSTKLQVFVEKVSDGMPLPEYLAAIMRQLRNTPGVVESAILRRAQFQDLDAREIVFEMPDPEGEMTRSVLWVTVHGPLAVSFSFVAPLAHAAEVEPYFKAVVQSVIFVPKHNYAGFEALRTTAIKTSAPASISELQGLVATLNEPNVARESATARLASLFVSDPDTVIDLLLDRRPLIRAAAVEALAESKNAALARFLWRAVDDLEPLVAEPAARAVAAAPDVVSELSGQSFEGFKTETIARIWPFLEKEQRIQILQTIFNQTAPKLTALPPSLKNAPTKHEVKVLVSELKPAVNGALPVSTSKEISFSPARNVQLGALTLLRNVAPGDFKLPLARIIAADYDVLTAAALQTAIERAEPLPTDQLLKLLMSNDRRVEQLAAESLGLSANVSDIGRIESLIARFETRASGSTKADGANDDLASKLKLSIRKIQFRDRLAGASKTSSQSSTEVITQGLSDSQLADFVWRYVCEETPGACAPVVDNVKPDFNVKPLAENLFPEKVEHFAALPNPGRTVQKFYESLQGIQMDSPRGQSNLVLVMGGIRKLLGEQLAAQPDDPLIDYTGIKADAPISMAAWIAGGAPEGLSSARRQALVLQISDRQRFERLVEVYQKNLGTFAELPGYLAAGTRLLAALPAILPLTAKTISTVPSKPKPIPLLKYSFAWQTKWNGFPIKIIEHRQVDSAGKIENSATYLTFLGDTALVAPNIATIRELLVRAGGVAHDQPALAGNPEFRRVSENSGGDVVYFADLKSLLASFGESNKEQLLIKESGELKISKSSWENFHRLSFDESDWSQFLIPFKPGELSAATDLLPSSTVAYYLMKFELSSVWPKWVRTILDQKDRESLSAFWTLDFEKEVLPELGPECGVALLDLPDMEPPNVEATWLAFCKLKGDKLQNAFAAGKLFRAAGTGPLEIKRQNGSMFVSLKNGFLVFSNRARGFDSLDGKEKLVSTRDYSRAAAKVPGRIVAFGGYNLEAAVANASLAPRDGLNAQVAEVVASLARAFHSQNFFATASAGAVEAQSSVAMDREGRYAVSELSYQPTAKITYATVEPRGMPIADQKRISTLALRIRARAAGAIERIKDDVKSPYQTVEQKSAEEFVITVASRRAAPDEKRLLPINNPDFAPFLKATAEIRSDDEQVVKQAREIAGEDRDAWSVARKLADWTHTNLEWKYVARADAGQTLATREADCSEFSQLYVAMARSLGLPARIVSGLAYSGTLFGGHAWVEVWAGRWIELDPTWGTHFVDATHIRNDSGALLTYAALNLIDLEVVDARRTVADFQLKPVTLAEQLTRTIPAGDYSALEAAFDLAVATDEVMGKGAWATMSESERDQMSSAYRRVILEIILGYGKEKGVTRGMRLLRVEEKGDHAEATCLMSPEEILLKLHLLRRDNNWHLVEILMADTDLHIVSETLRPTIQMIEDRRASRKPNPSGATDFVRGMLLLENKPQKTVEITDRALKITPSDRGLRYLKALGLIGADKRDDAVKLLTELGNEQPAFAPALYKLAQLFKVSENEAEKKQVIELYQRYILVEPYDSRAHRQLALLYDNAEEAGQAEAAYRKAIEVDPTNSAHYLELVEFLVHQTRLDEAATILAAGDKHKRADEDLFGQVIQDLYLMEDYECAESFASSQPERMKTSSTGNLSLARVHSDNGRYLQALRLLKVSARLDQKSTEPLTTMAEVYRKLGRWQAALVAADQAIALEPENSEAHFQRACALARLGRTSAAMAALSRSVELEPYRAEWISEEKDLKTLRALAAFKKLVAEPEKQQ